MKSQIKDEVGGEAGAWIIRSSPRCDWGTWNNKVTNHKRGWSGIRSSYMACTSSELLRPDSTLCALYDVHCPKCCLAVHMRCLSLCTVLCTVHSLTCHQHRPLNSPQPSSPIHPSTITILVSFFLLLHLDFRTPLHWCLPTAMAPLGLRSLVAGAMALLPFLATAYHQDNSSFSDVDMLRAQLALLGDRPKDCPPCFNCLLPAHTCTQYASCNEFNGKCDCPEGFGGDDCLEPCMPPLSSLPLSSKS